jgi:hypothetical protein
MQRCQSNTCTSDVMPPDVYGSMGRVRRPSSRRCVHLAAPGRDADDTLALEQGHGVHRAEMGAHPAADAQLRGALGLFQHRARCVPGDHAREALLGGVAGRLVKKNRASREQPCTMELEERGEGRSRAGSGAPPPFPVGNDADLSSMDTKRLGDRPGSPYNNRVRCHTLPNPHPVRGCRPPTGPRGS